MKRCSTALSLLILFVCVQSLMAQRPRRVGETRTSNPPQTPQLPPGTNAGARPQSSGATTGPEEVDSNDILRINTTLVTIPVSVMERDGRYVPNLRKEDFRIWEDGVEQQVAYFAAVDKPFNVVLVIDTSSSTRFELNEIQDAAITFVNQLKSDDQVMVVTFDDKIRILTDFTSDRRRLQEAIGRTRTGNGTRLYDAVDMVINERLGGVQGKKAIVLFTDGVDTTSRQASYEGTVRDAEELDALIFPVQYDTYAANAGGGQYPGGGGWPGSRSSGSILIDILGNMSRGGRGNRRGGGGGGGGLGTSRSDYELANRYLNDLSNVTGGCLYEADTTFNLAAAFANVAEALRRQYSVGYYPRTQSQAGQRHSIRVRTTQSNLAVRARESYIFNPQQNAPTSQNAQAPVLQKKLASTQPKWP